MSHGCSSGLAAIPCCSPANPQPEMLERSAFSCGDCPASEGLLSQSLAELISQDHAESHELNVPTRTVPDEAEFPDSVVRTIAFESCKAAATADLSSRAGLLAGGAALRRAELTRRAERRSEMLQASVQDAILGQARAAIRAAAASLEAEALQREIILLKAALHTRAARRCSPKQRSRSPKFSPKSRHVLQTSDLSSSHVGDSIGRRVATPMRSRLRPPGRPAADSENFGRSGSITAWHECALHQMIAGRRLLDILGISRI